MPRPGRAYWKGFLRLSLVSIPVEIYTAVETAAAISLNQIHKPTGERIVAKPSPAAAEGKVVDLLDALRMSLKTSGGDAPKRTKTPQKKAS